MSDTFDNDVVENDDQGDQDSNNPYKLERAPYPEHPNRCQATDKFGQCQYLAVSGCTNCGRHGGAKQAKSAERKKLHDYNLHKWQVRVNDFAASERVTTLHGEIGILRMTLEQTLNSISDERDLMLYASRISDLVMKIERLVVSMDRLEMKSGNLLSKSALLSVAEQVVDVLTREIKDDDTIERINEQIITLVGKMVGDNGSIKQ